MPHPPVDRLAAWFAEAWARGLDDTARTLGRVIESLQAAILEEGSAVGLVLGSIDALDAEPEELPDELFADVAHALLAALERRGDHTDEEVTAYRFTNAAGVALDLSSPDGVLAS